MSTQEVSRNERAVKVPAEGWCWLRKDAPDEHTRQYWRDGKAFCLIVASPSGGKGIMELVGGWLVSVFWDMAPGKIQSKSHNVSTPTEVLALQAMDQVAIGIHATLAAQGIEIANLNAAKSE